MEEENAIVSKPKKIWNDALKAVKGENTNQLIEQFTAEMTLVAEGLCEDQNKLRGEVDKMITEEDKRIQKQSSRIDILEKAAEEERKEQDRIVSEFRNRLASLENQAAKNTGKKEKKGNIFRNICITVVVTAIAVIAVVLVIKLV